MGLRVGDRVRLVGPSWDDTCVGAETIVIEDQGLELLCMEREYLVLDPRRPRQMLVYESDLEPIPQASHPQT